MNGSPISPPSSPARRVSARWTYAVILVTFLFVILPFLFWETAWFGRPLSDAKMAKYLENSGHPRETQHALSQIADRIVRGDATIRRWYPLVVGLAGNPTAEIRITTAWVMGQDNTAPEFHQALLRMLADPQPMVRANAALSLVRFGDSSGRAEILAMLRPYGLPAPQAGTLFQRLKPGETVNPGTLVGRIGERKQEIEIRSAVPGTLVRWAVADGASVAAQQTVAWLAPNPQQAWEALRALYLIGRPEDLADVLPYVLGVDGMPPQVQQQAQLTAREIRTRSGS